MTAADAHQLRARESHLTVNLTPHLQSEAFQEAGALLSSNSTDDALVFVPTQGARCSGLGSFAVPAPAAGLQRQTRPVDFARRRPHPYWQPET